MIANRTSSWSDKPIATTCPSYREETKPAADAPIQQKETEIPIVPKTDCVADEGTEMVVPPQSSACHAVEIHHIAQQPHVTVGTEFHVVQGLRKRLAGRNARHLGGFAETTRREERPSSRNQTGTVYDNEGALDTTSYNMRTIDC